MNIRDISNDTETIYHLMDNERAVFVVENRADEIVFELAGAGAAAYIFMLHSGSEDTNAEPRIIVRHLAPDTMSFVSVRARLEDRSALRFRGRIEIASDAVRSEAREDVRVLLLSPETRATTIPELEIKTEEVRCSHAATIAPPDPDQIHYLATRGLTREQAVNLLAEGFFKDVREEIEKMKNKEKNKE